jgi:hypothetical protein
MCVNVGKCVDVGELMFDSLKAARSSETQRQTERETERDKRQTERERQRETERDRERQRDRDIYTQIWAHLQRKHEPEDRHASNGHRADQPPCERQHRNRVHNRDVNEAGEQPGLEHAGAVTRTDVDQHANTVTVEVAQSQRLGVHQS